MSRKTKITEPFYKSQATGQRSQFYSPSRLYGSGASPVGSSPKISQKLMHQNICRSSKLSNKQQLTYQTIMRGSNFKKPINQFQQYFPEKKYSQVVRWQSPTRIPQKRQGFKNIIEEIHEHNDRALEQLDDDIRRIKNNLAKVQQEKNNDKKNSESQMLHEQIQLLQEENQRLRTKNFQMIEEKKKLTNTIERYEAFYQQEKSKLTTMPSIKHSAQQKSIEEFLTEKINLEQKLRQIHKQNQKLKFQMQKLQKTADTYKQSKKQVIQVEQISRLNKKIIDLQKELADNTLSYEQNLRVQLQKKDKYYLNWIEITKNKNEQALKKLQNSRKQQKSSFNEEILKDKQREISNLKNETNILSKRQNQLISKLEQNETQITQLRVKIDNVNNQNQFLNFTHKQTSQRLSEKEQQRKQLQKKLHVLNSQLQKNNTQQASNRLLWQQQKKRNSLLQELYNRLQSQYQNYESEAQNHLLCFKKTISDYQHELSQAKYQIDKMKQKHNHLQIKLQNSLKENQKLSLQNSNKNQQISCLKKEKILLINSQNQLKLETNHHIRPQTYNSPIRYETRQRFLSGEIKSNNNIVRERQKQKEARFKKIQKDLENMIQDLRLQKQKQRNIFKQKEKTYKSVIQSHRKQTEQYQNKIEGLKSEIEKLKVQKLKKQQEVYDIIRKKDSVIMNKQLKANQLHLKISKLESQSKQTKEQNQEYKNEYIINQSKIKKQIQENNKQMKLKLQDFLQKITKELNKIQDSYQTYTVKTLIFHSHEMNQLSSFIDFRKLTEFNYLVQNIKYRFRTITTKNKELQKKYQEKLLTQNTRNDYQNQQNLKQKIYNQSLRNENNVNKHQERKIIQSQEQQIKSLRHRLTDLEIEYERQVLNYKNLSKEKDQTDRLLKDKIREIDNLIEKTQSLEKQVSQLKQKQQSYIAQTQKLKDKLQLQKQMAQYRSPRKQVPNTRNNGEIVTSNEIPLNNRLQYLKRELLIEKKPSLKNMEKYNEKQMQKKIIQLQLLKMNFENQIVKRKQDFEELKAEKEELQKKMKRLNQRYEEKMNRIESLEQQIKSLRKKLNKSKQQSISLEKDIKILVSELESLNQKFGKQTYKLNNEIQSKQQKIKELSSEYQLLNRKLKTEVTQKDNQRISSTQKKDLRIVQLQAQVNNLKQKLGQCQHELQNLRQKSDKTLHKLQTNSIKLQQKQKEVKYLLERLQDEKNEKQKLFTIFNTNTNKLSKLLEQKQIEMEELKFIQESTIINYSERSSRNMKKQTESAFSFQHEY